ncbi:MAG: aminopeptidase N [Actinomycetaceae bacterium]|nr:aminopeptidase N [Arcanobacterium sp.]MDD7687560.1 aminopeptidase N [Actinomycetaceae bacterium]
MPGQNLTKTEAEERASLISTESYRVELDLTTSESTFTSISTVEFSAATPGTSTFIDLIAQSVQSIELNGEQLDVSSYHDSRIPLPNLREHNVLTVAATCIFSHSGEGLHRAVDPADGEVYLYSQFEVPDSRRMYAVFEQPDLKANFTFTITAPAHWQVFSVSPTPTPQLVRDGVARWDFTPTERISSYLTCVVAGPYEGKTSSYTSVDGRTIPMGAYCRRSLVEHLDADEVMDITKQGMDFYENAFQQPYPFRKYDQIFVPEYNMGAMEHPGCVTILDSYVFASKPTQALVERRAITVLHELAHMWFGDLVTMKWWNDLWLNESFAEFMSHVCANEATKYKQAWITFNVAEKVWAQDQDQLPSTHPISAVIRNLEDTMVNFDGITYGKGASVFQQLVAYVGWDAFITGVQRYLAKKAWGNATLQDLLVELEAASGRDLKAWSKVWLEEAGITTLTPEIKVSDDGAITSFEIIQTSDGRASLRPHRIGVGGYRLNAEGVLERVAHTELDIDGERTAVPDFVGMSPRPDVIVVNDGDLAYAKVRLDPDSLTYATEHINDFSDHLTRTLILDSAWDMLRDAELSAHDFVPLALRALETETHGTVLRYLLSELLTAANIYSHPQSRKALQARVAAALEELVRSAEPGSDRQLQLAQSFVIMAQTDQQIAWITQWLDSDSQSAAAPDGLAMDPGMRWAVIQRLAQLGAVDAEYIEAERAQRDNTATGQEQAARARAGIPEAKEVAAAWDRITNGETINSIQRQSALGFAANTPDMLAPYAQQYFDELENQWTNRSKEIAENMIKHAFPLKLTGLAPSIGIDLVAIGEAWMDTNGEHAAPALVRLASEVLDSAHRAERAQAYDAER